MSDSFLKGSRNMRTSLSILFALLSLNLYSQEFVDSSHYYSESFLQKINDINESSDDLKNEIFNLSSKNQTRVLSYDEARKVLFGNLFLEDLGNKKYEVKDVYCNIRINQVSGAGPGNIPNQKLMNCEHTWPQSKFTKEFPAGTQKSDLHHLFPVDMKANSTRGNNPFAEVNGTSTHSQCNDSQVGQSTINNARSFEPPPEHRGNVARAIYYFSTRYKMPLDSAQAHFLKKWNNDDPVDNEEIIRNDKIMSIQGNRNPFVDHPELIDKL